MRDLMQKPIIESLPKKGYYVSKEEKKQKIYKNESHIHKQGPLSGLKAGAHRFYNDIFTYFPKGFAGSKNSDFYEYLSLGMIPYVIGSGMLIALYSAANKNYNAQSARAAGNVAKRMGAGVILYGIGKWLSKKISHKLIKNSTGVDLDLKYLNKVNELPENGKNKGITRIQYPGVFDSADFPRKDLIALDNELNYDNVYAYEDRIAKKAGFKDKLSAPNQTMWPKIRELKVRTTTLENLSKYIMAATGVALGSQKAFENLGTNKFKSDKIPLLSNVDFKNMDKFTDLFKNLKTIGNNFISNIKLSFSDFIINSKDKFSQIKKMTPITTTKNIIETTQKTIKERGDASLGNTIKKAVKEACKKISPKDGLVKTVGKAFKQLWQGNDRNILTKHFGKALILMSVVSTLLTWLIPTIHFKKNPNTMKSKVDGTKDYEVC